ncbi:phage tail tape measure protein, partial [Bacillus velezensis]|uniref:phage tail tape measure protein n=1 Tax=Bacillus velezensis TaxID=492670 RepID=UPI001F5C0641
MFARAAADTNAEASDMGEALKMVAPQAHGAGLSLEETAAAIGVLSDAGIKGSMAGSNLGMALTRVQNPSKEASGAMAELGF